MVHTQQGAPSTQAQSVTPSETQIVTQHIASNQPHYVTTEPHLYQVTPQTILPEHPVDTNDISEQAQQNQEVKMINQRLVNSSSVDNPADQMGDPA